MKYTYRTLLLVALITTSIAFSSCKKDKSTVTPVVFLTPDDLYISGNINDVISISVTARCDDKMNRFYIKAQPENGYQSTVFDTSFSAKKITYLFQYKIPSSLAGKSVVFSFNAIADNGNEGSGVKRLIVQSDTSVIYVEKAGNKMFANNPTVMSTEDAYNLKTVTPQQSAAGDSTIRDIQDNSGNDTVLSKRWISPAGGKFVRFNSFDYPNATAATVKSAFNSGTKLSIIDNLKEEDIIITKLGSSSTDIYVVVKIITIHDDIGKSNDYYRFDVKTAP